MTTHEPLEVTIGPMTLLDEAAVMLCYSARKRKGPAFMEFNGCRLEADQNTGVDEVIAAWDAAKQREAEAQEGRRRDRQLLHDHLKEKLDAFLNDGMTESARADLVRTLWDNKVGIVTFLQSSFHHGEP